MELETLAAAAVGVVVAASRVNVGVVVTVLPGPLPVSFIHRIVKVVGVLFFSS